MEEIDVYAYINVFCPVCEHLMLRLEGNVIACLDKDCENIGIRFKQPQIKIEKVN